MLINKQNQNITEKIKKKQNFGGVSLLFSSLLMFSFFKDLIAKLVLYKKTILFYMSKIFFSYKIYYMFIIKNLLKFNIYEKYALFSVFAKFYLFNCFLKANLSSKIKKDIILNLILDI